MANSWKIGRPVFDACGFKSFGAARTHVEKHFFNRPERWEDVCEATPASFRSALAKAQEDHGAISDEGNAIVKEARAVYEEAVRRACDTAKLLDQKAYLYQERSEIPQQRTGIVGWRGVFCSFSSAAVSDLRTAFRPRTKPLRGRVTEQQYVNAARTTMGKLMARSELLEKEKDD